MSTISDYLEMTEESYESMNLEWLEDTGSSGEMVYECYAYIPEDADPDLLEEMGWKPGQKITAPLWAFDEPDYDDQ